MRRWFLLVVLVLCFAIVPMANSATWTPSGKYGYVGISKAENDWYTWKTERGTVEWLNNYQANTQFSESASNCPGSDYCKENASETLSYTVKEAKFVEITGEKIPTIFSDDDSVFLIPVVSAQEKGIYIGVKPSPSSPSSGDYYMVGYERDFLGGSKGYHRLEMGTVSFSGSTASRSSKLACDGSDCPNGIYDGTDQEQFSFGVGSNGEFLVALDGSQLTPFGWVGAGGKVVVISNTGVYYPKTADAFLVVVALKKGDKTYQASDLAGNWFMEGFGDFGGQVFSFVGNATCEANGSCTIWAKDSSGTMEKFVETLSVSQDGSINDFGLGPSYETLRGAIGNNGQTMILAKGRTMIVGVKTPAKVNLTGVLLKNGWNLVGLIGGSSKSIGEIVGQNAQKIESIWKWVDNKKWAVYLPKMGAAATSQYAQTKGFDIISVINPGEGFWVKVIGLDENESLLIE
ncbi:MAG: hypothetical protein ACK4WB_05160 [Desulfatiglandales bacterium]